MSNALLFYCYLPLVVGSIACESKPIIALSTAQFILMQTFSRIKYLPIINTLVGSLILNKVPRIIKQATMTYPESDPSTYSFKWRYQLPSQITATQCKH
jgi:hypothetical protein